MGRYTGCEQQQKKTSHPFLNSIKCSLQMYLALGEVQLLRLVSPLQLSEAQQEHGQ